MDVEQLKADVAAGRISLERLVDLIGMLQRQLAKSERRVAELEKKFGLTPDKKLDEPYSMRAEEQRQLAREGRRRKRTKPQRRGRITTAQKLALATRTERVFPEGVAAKDCWHSHTRPLWRLIDGRAELVAYEIYRGPKNQYGQIPGSLGRSEFGLEIVVAIAYQVYVVGLSFDKVCLLLNFFQGLQLRKSQADALLNQLSRHWEEQFETLCSLLTHSAIVYADETSWSIHSVWALLSEQARLLICGVHKDGQTLAAILDPESFAGTVVSDDASVYGGFSNSQKCWAHLLRKAIKLTLLEPTDAGYREFTDRLLEIYRGACRVKRDGRLNDLGRKLRVVALDDEIVELCAAIWAQELPSSEGPANDFRLLCNELMRLMIDQQLFVFVTTASATAPNGETLAVAGTNNESERTLRSSAEARKTGRTSKTLRGARRRTVIGSVLDSLRRYLPDIRLSSVIAELQRWSTEGQSCFQKLLKRLKIPEPTKSILNQLYPKPAR